MNDESHRIWKKEVVEFKVRSRHFPSVTEKNHEKSVRLAGLRVEILTRDLPNIKRDY
jgi:hypothetical protein